MSETALKSLAKLYDHYFDQLYLYFARRVRTKKLVAFLVESVFQNLFDHFSRNFSVTYGLRDLYHFSWELLSKELEKTFGQQKTHDRPMERIQYFDDVYRLRNSESDVKSQRSDQIFERSPELDLFYARLLPMEREVLQLSVFEGLSEIDRAFVLNMNESDCTQLFYATLKKAKDLLDQAMVHQKVPQRFVPYFGNLLKLLQKLREEENLSVDQNLKISLRKVLFPLEFVSETNGPVENFEVQQKPEPEVQQETSSVSDEKFQWDDASESFSVRGFFRRFQAVFLLLLIFPFFIGLYYLLYSQNSQVKRLLADERIFFETRFSFEEKDVFIREVLLYLLKRRDFLKVNVEKLNDKRLVFFELKSGLREKFIVAPHAKPWLWQTKEYRQIASLNI